MEANNPKTGKPWTMEEMQARIAELESSAAKNKNNKGNGPKVPELRVTLDTGEAQLRHVTPTAITFPADTWREIFALAPKVVGFLNTNKHLLNLSGDGEIEIEMKKKLRRDDIANNPDTVVRKPKSTKIQKTA